MKLTTALMCATTTLMAPGLCVAKTVVITVTGRVLYADGGAGLLGLLPVSHDDPYTLTLTYTHPNPGTPEPFTGVYHYGMPGDTVSFAVNGFTWQGEMGLSLRRVRIFPTILNELRVSATSPAREDIPPLPLAFSGIQASFYFEYSPDFNSLPDSFATWKLSAATDAFFMVTNYSAISGDHWEIRTDSWDSINIRVLGEPPDSDSDGLLDQWELEKFGTLSGHAANDDFDHDGWVELIEEAFNTDPLIPGPSGPSILLEGGYLTTTITKRLGVTYVAQTADALATSGAFSVGTTTVLINDATTLKVRDNFTTSTAVKRFMRVKVTASPQ